MIVSTQGIIIKSLNYRETSKIVEVFTKEDGLISLVAKGVRNNKKTLGVLEPLNIVFVSYYKRSTTELFLLSKVETIQSFHKLLNSSQKLISGLTILELIHKTQPFGNQNINLFELTKNILNILKQDDVCPYIVITYFLIWLLKDLGIDFVEKVKQIEELTAFIYFDPLTGNLLNKFSNKTNLKKLNKGTINLIFDIQELSIDELNRIKVLNFNIIEFLTFFEAFLSFYLDKPFKLQTIELISNDI